MSTTSQQHTDRKTISEKKTLVEKWSDSKSIMKDFCKEHQITVSSLQYWKRQFGIPTKRKRKKHGFLPVNITAPIADVQLSDALFAEIILLNGTRVLFHQVVGPNILKSIIQ